MVVVAPLIALGTFALVMWLIALALAIAVVMGYISGILHGLPFPLNQLAGPVHSLAQGITNVAGKIEAGADHLIGASWHMLARYLDQQWHQLVWSAHVLAQIAGEIWRLTGAHIHLRSVVNHTVGSIGAVVPRVKTLEKEWHGIEHRVKTIEREIARGIGHDLRIRIKALEKEYTGLKDRIIPGLRSDVKVAEGDIASLQEWLGVKSGISKKSWLHALGVAVLGALGLGGMNCDSNPFKNNANPCGLWGDLSALLGLAFIAAEVASLEELIGVAQTVTEDVTKGVEALLNV